MAAILADNISIWNFLYLDLNFTDVCSEGSNWQYANIGSDNGLAPDRMMA